MPATSASHVKFAITTPMLTVYHRQWLIVKKQLLITLVSYWILCIMSTIGERAILDQVQYAMLVSNHAGPPIVWPGFVVNGVV